MPMHKWCFRKTCWATKRTTKSHFRKSLILESWQLFLLWFMINEHMTKILFNSYYNSNNCHLKNGITLKRKKWLLQGIIWPPGRSWASHFYMVPKPMVAERRPCGAYAGLRYAAQNFRHFIDLEFVVNDPSRVSLGREPCGVHLLCFNWQ